MRGVLTVLPNSTGGATHTAVNTGVWVFLPDGDISISTFLSAAGGTATVEVHGSNFTTAAPSAATLMATFTLSGANDRATLTKPNASYLYKCAVVTALSGAVLTVGVGS